jgi:DNA (cytosine-5)-methyltransferase 1
VLVENVPGLLVRGFGDVLGDLAALGYDAEWESIPAAAFGAPHLRYRVFVIAYPHGSRRGAPEILRAVVADANSERMEGAEPQPEQRFGECSQPLHRGSKTRDMVGSGDIPDPQGVRRGPQRPRRLAGIAEGVRDTAGALAHPNSERSQGRQHTGGCEGQDWWATEPNVGRVAHGVPAWVDRLRSLGNAVVPQVAEWIGKRLPIPTPARSQENRR